MHTFHTNITSTCRTISNIPADEALGVKIGTYEDSAGQPSSYETPKNSWKTAQKTSENSGEIDLEAATNKGKRRKKMDPLEQMVKQNEAKMNLMQTVFSKPPNSSLDHFFLSMCGTTKTLPLTAQARIKLQIADIVGQAEIEHLTSEEKTDTDDYSCEYLDE